MVMTHLSKKHDDLIYSDSFKPTRVENDTKYRVHGHVKESIGTT